MITQSVVLFDRDEANAMRTAQRSINIAFPTDGPTAVVADDPRRRVLVGLGSRNDPITVARLVLAESVLSSIIAACRREGRRSHWVELLASGGDYDSLDHGQRTMVDTLTDARRMQHREAVLAREIVRSALNLVDGTGGSCEVIGAAAEKAESLTSSVFEPSAVPHG